MAARGECYICVEDGGGMLGRIGGREIFGCAARCYGLGAFRLTDMQRCEARLDGER